LIQPADRTPTSVSTPAAPHSADGLLDRLVAEERRQRLGPPCAGLSELPAWGPVLLLGGLGLEQPAGLWLLARLLRRRPDLLVLAPEGEHADAWLALSRGDFGPLVRSVRRAPWHALRQLRLSGAVLILGAQPEPRSIGAALEIQAQAALPIRPLSAVGSMLRLGAPLSAFEAAGRRELAEVRLLADLLPEPAL
jgi:hypothetical protein